jgi:hypothetical protein
MALLIKLNYKFNIGDGYDDESAGSPVRVEYIGFELGVRGGNYASRHF